MGRKKRSEVFDPTVVGVYHCIQRAVRRAWLMGKDPVSGMSLEHRRPWIQEQLKLLAGIFAFDFLSFAILSNHLHVVVRNRPDILKEWSDREVAERWWQLCPGRRDADGRPSPPTEQELKPLLKKRRNGQLRARLGCISWLMRYLAEPIARRANAEDQCTGHFWEGRFKCQSLVDVPALLACCSYVDLNPVRAGMATSPQESPYTSAYNRLWAALLEPDAGSRTVDDWLAPVELDERALAYRGAMPSASGYRASDKGFLPISWETYLKLLQWTSLAIGKPGSVPSAPQSTPPRAPISAPPSTPPCALPEALAGVLASLGLDASAWCDLIKRFGKIFKCAAGRPLALAQEAARRKQRWLQTDHSPLSDLAS